MNYYTITLIISILIILLIAVGIWTGFFEGIGRGFNNLHTLYENSSDSSPDGGIVEDTVQDDDPEDSVLAVDETFNIISATVTAYTSDPAETDDTPCENAWGDNICELHEAGLKIIACPIEYKKGQLVTLIMPIDDEIGYGEIYICLDRMNSRYDGQERFDIYFGHDKQGALEFGKRTLNIKIYNNL